MTTTQRPPRLPWTTRELRLLNTDTGYGSAVRLARTLNRTPQAVVDQRRRQRRGNAA